MGQKRMGKAKTVARTRKPTKKRSARKSWKKIATDLARCVLFALSHAKPPKGLVAGQGMRFYKDEKGKHHVEAWEIQFFDALDAIGYVIDRDDFYKKLSTKKGKRKG